MMRRGLPGDGEWWELLCGDRRSSGASEQE
jgi:hypothetical protein